MLSLSLPSWRQRMPTLMMMNRADTESTIRVYTRISLRVFRARFVRVFGIRGPGLSREIARVEDRYIGAGVMRCNRNRKKEAASFVRIEESAAASLYVPENSNAFQMLRALFPCFHLDLPVSACVCVSVCAWARTALLYPLFILATNLIRSHLNLSLLFVRLYFSLSLSYSAPLSSSGCLMMNISIKNEMVFPCTEYSFYISFA